MEIKHVRALNSVSYEVLKHIGRVLRYGRDQEVVNFLTQTVADPLSRRHGHPEVCGPQVKNRYIRPRALIK
jgi:hypothetical protein